MAKKVGRPSKYTPELIKEICERLSKGEPLAAICRGEHMPHDSTVRDWMDAMPEVFHAIARARESGEDWIAAHCLNIADDNTQDEEQVEITDGVMVTRVNHDVIQRAKLRIDTRLKLLAKWNPKKYGDKLDVTSDGKALPTVNIVAPTGKSKP